MYIYLSNTLCTDDFPDNKPNKFTNLLNEELVLDGQWLVNLHEICYESQTWHNIRSSNNKINVKISNILLECEIPIGEYLNGEDLMQEILNAINHVIYKFVVRDSRHPLAKKYWRPLWSGNDWITRTGQWTKPQPRLVIDEKYRQKEK